LNLEDLREEVLEEAPRLGGGEFTLPGWMLSREGATLAHARFLGWKLASCSRGAPSRKLEPEFETRMPACVKKECPGVQ
jgi:hypothetical protein